MLFLKFFIQPKQNNMTFHSNQINQGLPLNARQIQDFQIYDSPTYPLSV